jgi:hypothetical protein
VEGADRRRCVTIGHAQTLRPDRLRCHRLHRAPGGRVPAHQLRRGRAPVVGTGGAQPRSARAGAAELGAGEALPLLEADAGDARSLSRLVGQARVIITTVGPYQLHGQALVAPARKPAPTMSTSAVSRPGWRDDPAAAGAGAAQRRAHRLLLRLRLDPLRPRRALPAAACARDARCATAAGAWPREGDEGRHLGRHGWPARWRPSRRSGATPPSRARWPTRLR